MLIIKYINFTMLNLKLIILGKIYQQVHIYPLFTFSFLSVHMQ